MDGRRGGLALTPAARMADPSKQADQGNAPLHVPQVIGEGLWTRQQKIVQAMLVVIFVSEGIDGNVLGASIPKMASDWGLPPSAFATAHFLSSLGAALGVALGGPVTDRLGRKWPLTITTLIFGLATAAIAFADDLFWLGAARFVAGIGLGMNLPAGLALVAELSPHRYRGRTIAAALALTVVGIVFSSAMAGLLLEDYGWRILFFIGGIIPAAWAVLLMFTLPESPSFLAGHPARRAQLDRVMDRLGHPVRGRRILYTGEGEKEEKAARPLSNLLQPETLRATFFLCAAFFCLFLMISTIFSWLPTMLAAEGFSLRLSNFAITVWSLGGIAGTLVTGRIIEVLGSIRTARLLVVAALIFTFILFSWEYNPDQAFWLFAIFVIEGSLASGMTTALYAAAADAFPAHLRGTGIGLGSASGRVGMLAAAYLGALALELAGVRGFFGLALTALVAVAVISVFLPARAQPMRSA